MGGGGGRADLVRAEWGIHAVGAGAGGGDGFQGNTGGVPVAAFVPAADSNGESGLCCRDCSTVTVDGVCIGGLDGRTGFTGGGFLDGTGAGCYRTVVFNACSLYPVRRRGGHGDRGAAGRKECVWRSGVRIEVE